jgi:TonB family protein
MPGTIAAAPPLSPVKPPSGDLNSHSPALVAAMKPAVKPETLFGSKQTYTLNINMPNLTSAMGSWILTFAEMGVANLTPDGSSRPGTLSGPEALRKVDPKYPPELRSRRVEGEVVLYAIIRKDGTVDSIELLAGIDPVLDQNAVDALSQWKFRPAERQGTPIELEAIVRIPFRSVAPLY